MLDNTESSTDQPAAQAAKELAGILDRASAAISSVVIFTRAEADICAAWCIHTWCYDRFDHTPRLHISSPVPGCGKTNLMESIQRLAYQPTLTGNATPAVLFRFIEKSNLLTLLLDEVDTYLVHSEELRGIANMGYSRYGHHVMRCERVGDKMEPRKFATFAPMALGGIGRLPETVETRSIPVFLSRKRPEDKPASIGSPEVKAEFSEIQGAINRWIGSYLRTLATNPQPLGHPDGRKNDICMPLVAIGDAAGPAWGKRLRTALLTVLRASSWQATDDGTLLLRDCHAAFAENPGSESLSCDSLLRSLLGRDDSPWQEYGSTEYRTGRPLTKNKLGRMLGTFGVSSILERSGSNVDRVYRRADFTDAWSRYLPSAVTEKLAA